MCFHSVSFPLPFVQFSSSSFPHIRASSLSHLWSSLFARVPLRDSFVFRLCFPRFRFGVVFHTSSVSSFPFLSSSSFPSQFSRRLYVHRRFDYSSDLFRFPILLLLFGARFLWPAGRELTRPHSSTGAAKFSGTAAALKPFSNQAAVHRKQRLFDVNFHCNKSLTKCS